MKSPWLAACLLLWTGTSCSTYHPLTDEPDLYSGPSRVADGPGVKVTFLGNTTLLVSDGTTHLLVDGFLSRPGPWRTLFWRIAPDEATIAAELKKAGIAKLDAVLVGHAHHDHALDAPVVARLTGAVTMGSESYRHIHAGAGGSPDPRDLIVVPRAGATRQFGKFTVTFRLSGHVSAHALPQRLVEGDIERPLRTPAHYSRFNCGDVFAIHIAHPDGSIAVTTTAGAQARQFAGLEADALFLGVGLLTKEPVEKQDLYWQETAEVLRPRVIVPVHWDDFSRPLSKGLAPAGIDDVEGALDWVKAKAGTDPEVRLLGLRDTIRLRKGVVR